MPSSVERGEGNTAGCDVTYYHSLVVFPSRGIVQSAPQSWGLLMPHSKFTIHHNVLCLALTVLGGMERDKVVYARR